MKLPCKVIEDMLPMYYDGVCSKESTEMIEKHLKECTCCSRMLSDLRTAMVVPRKELDDIRPLKKIQKSYQKLRLGWLIAILCVLVLVPAAFLVGNEHGGQQELPVAFTKEEAIAYADAFMTCLEEKDYAKAYTYWNIEEEKLDLLSGNLLTEADLADFQADGLKKFCEGGEKLESWGGITDVQFVRISDASYGNRSGTEEYFISYTFQFNGKTESIGISLSKDGIDSLSSGDGLIRHPLSHLTLWVQWVVDDYNGRYYDFDLGAWIDKETGNEIAPTKE